jgi:hypothetical protein
MPLFVSITPGMKLAFPGETDADEGGGGPKDPREALRANMDAVQPSPKRHRAARRRAIGSFRRAYACWATRPLARFAASSSEVISATTRFEEAWECAG